MIPGPTNRAHIKFLAAQRVYRHTSKRAFMDKLKLASPVQIKNLELAIDNSNMEAIRNIERSIKMDLNELSLTELRLKGRAKSIMGWYSMNKDKLIEVLTDVD